MVSLLEEHTALYTPLDIEYAQEMSGPYDTLWLPCEVEGFPIVAAAGLKDGRISGFWRPVVAFGDPKAQAIFIDMLWRECSQDITYEDYLIDGELSPVSRFLLEKGYRATPVYTQVLDVTLAESVLRQGLRKSYRSLVNRRADVWECDMPTVRAIHLKVRGATRSDASWRIQERMPTVCFADGERAAVMFYVGPRWAYYACAAGEDGHACVWAALMKLHAMGLYWCEMGEQVFAGDRKKVNIAAYKRGFGGVTQTRLLLTRGPQ